MVAQYFITWLHYPKNCLTSPSGVDFQTHEKACSSDLYGVCGENAGTPLFLVAGWFVVAGEVSFLPVFHQDDLECVVL